MNHKNPLEKFLDRIVPISYQSNIRNYEKIRVIALATLCVLSISPGQLPLYLYYFNTNAATPILIFALIGGTALLYLIQKTSNLVVLGNFFIAVAAVFIYSFMYISGGIHSTFIVWAFIIPLMAYQFINLKCLFIWMFITSSMLIFFYLLDVSSIIQVNNHIPTDKLLFFNVIHLSSLATFLTFTFVSINSGKEILTEEILKKNLSLESKNKELARFAYIASHDLKTPLRNISSFLTLIQRKHNNELSNAANDYLNFAVNNAKRMYGIIEGILEFSTIEKNKLTIEEIDLNFIVTECMHNLQDKIQEKKAVIETSFLPTINYSRVQILQLFQNLIENGLTYNKSSVPFLHINFSQKEDKNILTFSDNGIGIKLKYHESIFEMFNRLHTEKEYNGTGIGLSICKKIVDTMEGEILVESTDKGTAFHVILPDALIVRQTKQPLETADN